MPSSYEFDLISELVDTFSDEEIFQMADINTATLQDIAEIRQEFSA